MCPELSVGAWSVSSYYLLHAAATVAGGLIFFHLMIRDGIEPRRVRTIIVVAAGCGLLGAVIAGLLLRLAAGQAPNGGLSGIGAIGGAFLGTLAYCRYRQIPVGTTMDRGAVAGALWLAVGRIGCAAAGCCYGLPTSGPLAWNLPDAAGVWLRRYPTQLFNSTADLLIFGLLLMLGRRRPRSPACRGLRPGDLCWLFVVLFAAQRLAIDFLRGDVRRIVGPLTAMQLVALSLLAVTAIAATVRIRRAARPAADPLRFTPATDGGRGPRGSGGDAPG